MDAVVIPRTCARDTLHETLLSRTSFCEYFHLQRLSSRVVSKIDVILGHDQRQILIKWNTIDQHKQLLYLILKGCFNYTVYI